MNMKKYFLAVPLSLALILPTNGLASAHTHSESTMTAMPAGAAEVSYQSHLNLITCTGKFNDEAKTHEERLVIYTELKK